jgi:2'-5' RNA ligase
MIREPARDPLGTSRDSRKRAEGSASACSWARASRWVAPATYHVTLKFIGWVRSDAAPAIGDGVVRAVSELREAPFAFRTARLGAFPTPQKANVVWAGIEDKTGGLGRLAAAVDRELEAVGVPREPRPFHGHVTLGRLRDPIDVSQVLLPFSEQVFSETRLTEVTLFESLTKSSGSEYSQVLRVPLFRPENEPKRQSRAVEPTPFDASDDGWDRDPERRS